MRKLGKIIDFTEYEPVKNKEGEIITGNDGLTVMKRKVIVDCGYISENGDEIKDGYVCDMFREITDTELQKFVDSHEKVAAYISMDYRKTDDGKYFQRITLHKIASVNV